jgi:ribosomal protein S18 acetylase RimI-like enzyme
MHDIRKATSADALGRIEALIELLRDSVQSGASVGFLATLTPDENVAYWRDTVVEVERGRRVLLVADTAGGAVAGSVQLSLTLKENGRHRASVEKLLVHTRYRGSGLARRLMSAVEQEAAAAGVTLLVLDTEVASLADTIYPRMGYVRVGEIPGYAASPDGSLHATAFYYKELRA